MKAASQVPERRNVIYIRDTSQMGRCGRGGFENTALLEMTDLAASLQSRSCGGVTFRKSASVRGEALSSQFLQGVLGLLQLAEVHPLEYVWCFGELDVGVLHYLPAVAPRVEEVEAPAGQDLHVHLSKRSPHRPPVVHHHPDMAMLVRPLAAPLGEGDELVSGVDERHAAPAPAQLHLEEAPVKLEGLLDVADLDGDVVEPYEPGVRSHAPILSARRDLVGSHLDRTDSAIASRPSISSVSNHCNITRSTPASSRRFKI